MELYLGLFLIAFLAGSLVPAYSEVVFAGLLATGADPVLLWLSATTGNTLGACVNWALGRYLLNYRSRTWFPVNPGHLEKAQSWFNRYGVWSLLLAWAPVVGDALTFIAGVMRVRFPLFVLLTGTGKGVRYFVLLGILAWGLDLPFTTGRG